MRLNKIQQSFTNMKSTNTEIKLAMLELHTESAMVSEPSPPDQKFWATLLNLGVIELPTRKHKWTQEGNGILWKSYFESDKNKGISIRGYIESRECIVCGLREEAKK